MVSDNFATFANKLLLKYEKKDHLYIPADHFNISMFYGQHSGSFSISLDRKWTKSLLYS